jgi:hypothetical protein
LKASINHKERILKPCWFRPVSRDNQKLCNTSPRWLSLLYCLF